MYRDSETSSQYAIYISTRKRVGNLTSRLHTGAGRQPSWLAVNGQRPGQSSRKQLPPLLYTRQHVKRPNSRTPKTPSAPPQPLPPPTTLGEKEKRRKNASGQSERGDKLHNWISTKPAGPEATRLPGFERGSSRHGGRSCAATGIPIRRGSRDISTHPEHTSSAAEIGRRPPPYGLRRVRIRGGHG